MKKAVEREKEKGYLDGEERKGGGKGLSYWEREEKKRSQSPSRGGEDGMRRRRRTRSRSRSWGEGKGEDKDSGGIEKEEGLADD